jgi:hypothetical protein
MLLNKPKINNLTTANMCQSLKQNFHIVLWLPSSATELTALNSKAAWGQCS